MKKLVLLGVLLFAFQVFCGLSLYAQETETNVDSQEIQASSDNTDDTAKEKPAEESKEICYRCGEYEGSPKCCVDEGREWCEDCGYWKGSPGCKEQCSQMKTDKETDNDTEKEVDSEETQPEDSEEK